MKFIVSIDRPISAASESEINARDQDAAKADLEATSNIGDLLIIKDRFGEEVSRRVPNVGWIDSNTRREIKKKKRVLALDDDDYEAVIKLIDDRKDKDKDKDKGKAE